MLANVFPIAHRIYQSTLGISLALSIGALVWWAVLTCYPQLRGRTRNKPSSRWSQESRWRQLSCYRGADAYGTKNR